MITVKAFLESVERACPDVAKNYTQGANNQYKGCIFERMVIGLRAGGRKIEFIEKWGIQNQPYYKSFIIRASENENLQKDLYLLRQIFPSPFPIEIAVRVVQRWS